MQSRNLTKTYNALGKDFFKYNLSGSGGPEPHRTSLDKFIAVDDEEQEKVCSTKVCFRSNNPLVRSLSSNSSCEKVKSLYSEIPYIWFQLDAKIYFIKNYFQWSKILF
jgi:hypothetical protein